MLRRDAFMRYECVATWVFAGGAGPLAGRHFMGEAAKAVDLDLVRRAGAGDRLAASELIVRHTDKIMGLCYRMLGERSAAEDAVQETFLRLWKNAGKWRDEGAKIETWLYRVAKNICLDRLRKSGREVAEDAAPEQADGADGAETQMIKADRAKAVKAALARLPDRQRLAIALCHYQEKSNIEAAEIMDVSVEAVESLLSRARRTLRKTLAPQRAELVEGGMS